MAENTRRMTGLTTALLLSVFAFPALAQNPLTDIPVGDEGMVTGPKIGERIPDFAAFDRNGALVGFDDIKGPNGAMILFHRSADW